MKNKGIQSDQVHYGLSDGYQEQCNNLLLFWLTIRNHNKYQTFQQWENGRKWKYLTDLFPFVFKIHFEC